MELQNKINKRIQQLEAELEQLDVEKKLSYLEFTQIKVKLLQECIQELKQLLNN